MTRAGLAGRALATGLAAVAIAACGSSAPSTSAFKTGFQADRAQFRQLGLALESAISGARTKTDAELAGELRPLATRAREQATQLAALKPPASYKANVAKLIAGFDAISRDLKQIANAASANDAQAASSATRALVADATSVKAADLAITNELRVQRSKS